MGHSTAPQVMAAHATRNAILFRDGQASAEERASLLCTNPCATWVIRDAETLWQATRAADTARERGQVAVFALDYELGALLEPAVAGISGAARRPDVPRGYVWLFDAAEWLTLADADTWLMQGATRGIPAGCVRGRPALDALGYAEKLQTIRQAISDGEVYQINFTFPLDVTIYGALGHVFHNLAVAQPTAHAVLIDVPECQAMSLSPELFFTVETDRIAVRPMKGTAPRLVDAAADQAQAAALHASEKNRAENLMIVDLLRNDLGRISRPGSVTVETLFEVEAYPTVHQMTSTVSAQLQTDRLEDLVRGLFPCGSVTGAPKIAAMQKIQTLETSRRGLYTGTIGWAAGRRIQANVAIRTIVLDPPLLPASTIRTGLLGVGSGIVWDSEPTEEYAECLLKSDFLVKPDPGFTLFETLRLELPPDDLMATLPLDEIFPWVRRHIARMHQSAYALGFTFDRAAFEASLWQLKQEARQKLGASEVGRLLRARVDLAHAGQFTTHWAPLPPIADRVTVIWSDTPLAGDDPLLRHKTSARALYDAAIDQAMAQQAFDVLFSNERGEVCEGARSNVFVREGARLLTPPLRCGLLPGVLRAALLDTGEASEAILTAADIKAASREGRLRVGNALRGLMPATLK